MRPRAFTRTKYIFPVFMSLFHKRLMAIIAKIGLHFSVGKSRIPCFFQRNTNVWFFYSVIMMMTMIGSVCNYEIFLPIVVLFTVHMMYYFSWDKISSNNIFHNKYMLTHISSPVGFRVIFTKLHNIARFYFKLSSFPKRASFANILMPLNKVKLIDFVLIPEKYLTASTGTLCSYIFNEIFGFHSMSITNTWEYANAY